MFQLTSKAKLLCIFNEELNSSKKEKRNFSTVVQSIYIIWNRTCKPQYQVFCLRKEAAYALLVIVFAITLALFYLAREEESHFEISASVQKPIYEKQLL